MQYFFSLFPGVDFLDQSDIACKLTFFLRYSGRLCSSWITVLISAERFIAIVHPLHVASITTPRKAKIALAITVLVCIVMSAFPLFTVGTRQYNRESRCLVRTDRDVLYDAFTWVSLRFGELLAPSIIVSIFTVAIIVKLTKESRNWARCLVGQKNVVFHRVVQERQLTGILLTIAIMFVLIRLPYTVFYYINNYKKHWWGHRDNYAWISYYVYASYTVSMCLSTINYVINFFVYYLLGSTFRRELKKLAPICRKPVNNQANGMTARGTCTRYSFISGGGTSSTVASAYPRVSSHAMVKYTKSFKVHATSV